MDQEIVQKPVIRLILSEKYDNYEDGLLRANIESLKQRGENFARPLQSIIQGVSK